MKVAEVYSHLNGLEYLEARKPHLWAEVCNVIAGVDAASCFTKVSKEVRKQGRTLYSPSDLNAAFKLGFSALLSPWVSMEVRYWVCSDAEINRKIAELQPDEQRRVIEGAGFVPRVQTQSVS